MNHMVSFYLTPLCIKSFIKRNLMFSFWFQLPEVLDEMQKLPLFKGVRHILDLEQPDWITREDVHTGLKVLEDRGIPYDLLLRYT